MKRNGSVGFILGSRAENHPSDALAAACLREAIFDYLLSPVCLSFLINCLPTGSPLSHHSFPDKAMSPTRPITRRIAAMWGALYPAIHQCLFIWWGPVTVTIKKSLSSLMCLLFRTFKEAVLMMGVEELPGNVAAKSCHLKWQNNINNISWCKVE